MSPQEVLRNVFGYHSFRGQQEEIIQHVVEGGDALVLMPTGGGKSLCYQIPAIVREGVGVVVSPLIALMQDQVTALREVGVRAAFFNSSLSGREAAQVETALRRGELDIVYVAPERLMTEWFQELLSTLEVSLFAIDEAHCVSQWGHDFRPEYMALSVLHEKFPHIPRIGLTATADDHTRKEIGIKLNLTDARLFIAGFDRPNIRYRVSLKDKPKNQLLEFLEGRREESGIVYCLSRNKVDETARWLREAGWNALPYHAGMDSETRASNQSRFIREDGVVMVATIAFGMGIDKPDVRFVAHLDLPKSIESYYQETGRAGRDGLPSDAWMVYSLGDVVTRREMLQKSDASADRKKIEQTLLNALLGYCETTRCRREVLLKYFGEDYPGPCGNCDTCLDPVSTWEGTVTAQKALSAVYRTGQRFGVGYLVKVLRGEDDERVVRFRHNQLAVFGVGADLGEREWQSVFRQLIAAGYLEVDIGGYGSLLLTQSSQQLLRGEETISFRRDHLPTKKKSKSAKSGTTKERRVVPGLGEEGLFHELRRHRMAIAKERGVPAYVVFHDATLVEMAALKPGSLEELRKVSGVGEAKLAQHGESFLEVIRSFGS